MLVESGCTPEQADQCLALASIRTEDLSFVDAVRALGVSDPLIEEGLAGLAAVVDAGRTHAPGRVVADLKLARGLDYYTGTVYEVLQTLSLRDRSSVAVCIPVRWPAAVAMTPWRPTGRRPIPASGSRSGCPGCSGCSSGKGWCRPPGLLPPASWWP